YSPEMTAYPPASPPDMTPLSTMGSANGAATYSPPSNTAMLRVRNLPQDIKEREFRVMFTFAKDFLSSELLPSMPDEYGRSKPCAGTAYFKSVGAACDARDWLLDHPDLYADGMISENGSSSPKYSSRSLICDVLTNSAVPAHPFDTIHKHHSISGPVSHSLSYPSVSSASSLSSFPISSATFPALNGRSNSHFGPHTTAPITNGKSSSKFFDSLSPASQATVPSGPEPPALYSDSVFAASSSPRATFSPGSGDFPRTSYLDAGNRDDDLAALSHSVASAALSQDQVSAVGGGPWSQSDRVSRRNTSATVPARAFGSMSLQGGSPPTSFPNAPSVPNGVLQPLSGSVGSPTSTNGGGVPQSGSSGQVGGQPASLHVLQSGGRVLPPANPADQNPPCNTLYVGNLPMNTSEDELKALFSRQRGYKRLCFRTKMNGPMCFVEFEDVAYATRALTELYGRGLSNSVKGGIRLSFSKNPLGVRSNNGSNGGSSQNSSMSTGSNG
ncbi:uncharacterized protein V1518DRAFT_367793, partial [Limtongia smithiae]|uniref:uncharacterized protein n=1 Tax=Limtongia smithiae TaxID=1125753 RepID=UPI0034CFB2E9